MHPRNAKSDTLIKLAHVLYGLAFGVGIGFEIPRDSRPQPWPPATMFVLFGVAGIILHVIGWWLRHEKVNG